MDNDATFVATEGVYSLTEEQKPPAIHAAAPALNSPNAVRMSTVIVRFPSRNQSQGLSGLLGGGKDSARVKDKDKDKDERASQSSSGDEAASETGSLDLNPAYGSPGDTPAPLSLQPSLFSPPTTQLGKKKQIFRPKHNIRTTSSTFVTRLQSAEGLSKSLATKSGDVTFIFYNSGKSFFWTEPKAKVGIY